MAVSATSLALRTSLARAAAPRTSILHASKALRPSILANRSPLATVCTHIRSAHFERRPFHSSAKRELLRPLPQKIEGGVNEPAPVPPPHPMHGSYHWDFERLVSIGLVPLTLAPFISGSLNPTMDAILCTTLLIHSHIGFQSIIIDYLPSWRVPKLRALFWWGLRLGSVLVGVGLYEFETNDVGLTETIKRVWKA